MLERHAIEGLFDPGLVGPCPRDHRRFVRDHIVERCGQLAANLDRVPQALRILPSEAALLLEAADVEMQFRAVPILEDPPEVMEENRALRIELNPHAVERMRHSVLVADA